jgi:predicted transcriptional regulator
MPKRRDPMKQNLYFRAQGDDRERLQAIADKEDRPMSAIIRRAVHVFLAGGVELWTVAEAQRTKRDLNPDQETLLLAFARLDEDPSAAAGILSLVRLAGNDPRVRPLLRDLAAHLAQLLEPSGPGSSRRARRGAPGRSGTNSDVEA